MSLDANEFVDISGCTPRTLSNASQQSEQSYKQHIPMLTSDSGHYTCSSNTSDCSLQLESDTDSYHQRKKDRALRDERLHLALQDVCKLSSELERLTKSEQWYKHELRAQKTTRLNDLERIYTQERKFLQENQRLQKECVRLYEKCNDLERELEKPSQVYHECNVNHVDDKDKVQNVIDFEKEKQFVLIKDQQQLISVLRKQKRSLLEDLRTLTKEKDEKVLELQSILADLEFDNKIITKKCTDMAKDRLKLESNLKDCESKLSLALQEKNSMQKYIVDLKETLQNHQLLIKLKENEIERIQQHYTNKIEHEQDMDKVHKLSVKYQEEINDKTLEIINLKEKLHKIQDEIEDMHTLQLQNEQKQRKIDHLNFAIEAYRLELQELKVSEEHKNKQLAELHTAMENIVKEKENVYKTTIEQQNDLLRLEQNFKCSQKHYEQVQELYKRTQHQLELLELEQGKVKFQNDRDQQEIKTLRTKLKEFLQQTTFLSNKIRILEGELAKVLNENSQLKEDSQQMEKIIKQLEEKPKSKKHLYRSLENIQNSGIKNDLIKTVLDTDALCNQESSIVTEYPIILECDLDSLQLQKQCEKVQSKLDFINQKTQHFENHPQFHNFKELIDKVSESQTKTEQIVLKINSIENAEKDIDLINLTQQGEKLQIFLDRLNEYFSETRNLLSHLRIPDIKEFMEKLVIENEILKKKLCATEREVLTLQINQTINAKTQKCMKIKEYHDNHIENVVNLQERLLKNDSKLYKLEKKFKTLGEVDKELEELKLESKKLKEQLTQEQNCGSNLNRQLLEETEEIKNLRQSLGELNKIQRTTKNQATQCFLNEDCKENSCEVKELKEEVLQLQQQRQHFLEQEDYKKERLQHLYQMIDFQNNKVQNIQEHQKDWEDVLTSLNNVQDLNEETHKELELKTRELEELNKVFEEQNEELRKLEEFTTLLEVKRQKENENLKLTFQKEISVIETHLFDYKRELEKQKLVNERLEHQNEKLQEYINGESATELVQYKNEIRELKLRISKITQEKENLLDSFNTLESENKDLKCKKREAILMPDMSLVKVLDISENISLENKQNINEEPLRILTKVVEAEYQRKMLRYDEHIHTLLSNLKSLKKSLKANEEKTALLSEEHLKTKEELKELQETEKSLIDMKLKYEQSQNTIKELKQVLAYEYNNFDLSDELEKCSENNSTTYEVSNLIDDYKKLIQQSAFSTKRPPTSAIMDLIHRSNQCVPNLHKLDNNVESLRSELQNFLTSYSQKTPGTSLIATASLSVPPSLMDELRAASEAF